MEWFYFIVIVVAIILLIIMLAYIGTRMVSNKKTGQGSSVFPPVKNNCPDLWKSKAVGNTVYCTIPASTESNVGDLYTNGKKDSVNFNIGTILNTGEDKAVAFSVDNANTSGMSGDCAKKKWANMHGISWDGISNYNQC
jgi:hypothetical protein